jgi:hypothetical protein
MSILTALPIGASTRDDLLARLSFDSTSSSVSDRSRPDLDFLEDHELNIVANHHIPVGFDPKDIQKFSNASNTIPKALASSSHIHPTKPSPSQVLRTRVPQPTRQHNRRISTTPPAAYIPHIPDRKSIRTVQMEPSPRMQLPVLRPRKSHLSSVDGNSIRATRRSQDDVFELH